MSNFLEAPNGGEAGGKSAAGRHVHFTRTIRL
jgi:hypothetical protein